MLVMSAQVGIGTENPSPSSALDVVATNKGFLPARVALTAVDSPNRGTATDTPINGLLVYNTATTNGTNGTNGVKPGYYEWQTNRWKPIGNETRTDILKTNYINPDRLGYNPTGTTAGAPNIISGVANNLNVVADRKGCKIWTEGNGHGYCAYQFRLTTNNSELARNWEQAFNFAKQVGGYLVTFTSKDEWDWVKKNIIDNTTGYNLNRSIWFGMNKVKNPGNPVLIEWITGESTRVDYSNTAKIQHNFDTNQPDNSGGVEGCGHVFSTYYSGSNGTNPTNRFWNDYPCNSTDNASSGGDGSSSGIFSQIIIEFQN